MYADFENTVDHSLLLLKLNSVCVRGDVRVKLTFNSDKHFALFIGIRQGRGKSSFKTERHRNYVEYFGIISHGRLGWKVHGFKSRKLIRVIWLL